MATPRLKVVATLIGFVALAVVIIWQQRRIDCLTGGTAILPEQVEPQAPLRSGSERQANPPSKGEEPSKPIASLSEAQFRELLRLRGEVGVLRSQLAESVKHADDLTGQLAESVRREAEGQAQRQQSGVPLVGIGAELTQQGGYAVINRMMPGSPAESSGQLHPGDRILAVAQGDNAFVDARTLALGDLVRNIRGAPGTLVQLQVLPADVPADSPPKTVTLRRDQIKFDR